MTIFFLNAPAQATRRVLPLMKEGKYNDITVVVPEDLAEFFENHTDAKVIVSKVHQNLITQKTKHKLISNTIKSILEYRKLFKGIKGEDVCLFCSSWAVLYFSYVAKLSKHNNISDLNFVLPNKRAGLFLKEEISNSLQKSTILPRRMATLLCKSLNELPLIYFPFSNLIADTSKM